MITQILADGKFLNLSRQQKRALERQQAKERKRLEKLAQKTNLPVTFDNHTITGSGGFGLFEAFKEAVGFKEIVQKHFKVKRHHNCIYPSVRLIDTLIDNIVRGHFRFEHMNALKLDPGYKTLKGLAQVPDESTQRYFLSRLDWQDVAKLKAVNQALLQLKAATETPREIWLDVDDTVMTVFGAQEGSEVGYNPRYHGRPSYKVKVAFIAGTGELLNAELYGGKTASNGGFIDFFKETIAKVNPRMVVKGVRMDKGFFDEANFEYMEDNCLEYVGKVPLRANIHKIIAYLDAENAWCPLDDTYAVAEITVPLPAWKRARRFIFVRETVKTDTRRKQIALNFKDLYDYEVMVTNMEDLTPEEVWRWYNKRANVENKIDELKTGVGLDQNSQHEMLKNKAFMWIKILGYNLLNWFRLALLPDGVARCEVPTIRRLIINVPGNIVGNGRYRHIRLAPNRWLAETIGFIKAKLKEFINIKAWVSVTTA